MPASCDSLSFIRQRDLPGLTTSGPAREGLAPGDAILVPGPLERLRDDGIPPKVPPVSDASGVDGHAGVERVLIGRTTIPDPAQHPEGITPPVRRTHAFLCICEQGVLGMQDLTVAQAVRRHLGSVSREPMHARRSRG